MCQVMVGTGCNSTSIRKGEVVMTPKKAKNKHYSTYPGLVHKTKQKRGEGKVSKGKGGGVGDEKNRRGGDICLTQS